MALTAKAGQSLGRLCNQQYFSLDIKKEISFGFHFLACFYLVCNDPDEKIQTAAVFF